MRKIGIIGGTGVEDTSIFGTLSPITVETPFGTAEGFAGKIDDTSVYFIARHGKGHSLPPHRIPYRANIYALKKLGVTEILSFTAVGSLNRGLLPGTFVNTSQILDFTKSREHTFFDGGVMPVCHVDTRDWFDYEAVEQGDADPAALRSALEAAVRRQLMSDVPYGVLLSGGLDSSIISAVAKRFADRRIETEGRDGAWSALR